MDLFDFQELVAWSSLNLLCDFSKRHYLTVSVLRYIVVRLAVSRDCGPDVLALIIPSQRHRL